MPGTNRRRQLWIFLALLISIGFGAWLSGLAGSGGSAWVTVLTIAVVGVGQSVANRHTKARRWLIAASAAAAVAAFCAAILEPSLVLLAEGREVTAVVTYVDTYQGGHGQTYTSYSLRQLDGTPIRGQLSPGEDMTVGQRVTVIEDPSGNADPSLPADLDIPAWSTATGVGLLALALCLVMIGRAGVGEDTFWPLFLRIYGIGRKRGPTRPGV